MSLIDRHALLAGTVASATMGSSLRWQTGTTGHFPLPEGFRPFPLRPAPRGVGGPTPGPAKIRR